MRSVSSQRGLLSSLGLGLGICSRPLAGRRSKAPSSARSWTSGDEQIRGNHLSNTTCLTQVFFKGGEYFAKL